MNNSNYNYKSAEQISEEENELYIISINKDGSWNVSHEDQF